jgi:hypothetical protein
MMQLHSPGPRLLAEPGSGFPQSVSLGPNVVDLAAFRRARMGDAADAHKLRSDVLLRADDRGHPLLQLIACCAAAVIAMAAIAGPLVAWLLSRAAALAS